jgi:RNA polymerase sigma-70 factor (ECF subfamily)
MSPLSPEAAPHCGDVEWFHTTHWSVVLSAGQRDAPGGREALEALCRAYWYPLFAYVRRRGHGPEEAQDLTQEFFARLLERNDLARASPEKGRFRSFLLGAMNHFLAYEWRKAQAFKRGGGQSVLSLDGLSAEARYGREPVSKETPETLNERRWALTLFDAAYHRLQAEWTAAGRNRQFELIKPFLSSEAADGEYAPVAAALQVTVGAVSVAVHRLRHRYAELVRAEVAQTVATPAEVEDELRFLLSVMT